MTEIRLPDGAAAATLAAGDTEFLLAARHWNGGIRISVGDQVCSFAISNGKPVTDPAPDQGVVAMEAPADVWEKLTRKVPPRFFNDLAPTMSRGVELTSDPLLFTQYYGAIQRLIELFRPHNRDQKQPLNEVRPEGHHDAPVGRYIHLMINGQDHRVYYETAGQGIPIVLQHTSGAHGTQWRHLFEMPGITDRFQLIAYDLPFHGKSVPPVGQDWWAQEYSLTGDVIRAVPVSLARVLGLVDPVFMGVSIGGVLALDLAYHHPEVFSHVISVEGALTITRTSKSFFTDALWHPQVSNEFKGRMMHGLTAPLAPEAYRRETIQVYQAGWPPLFHGDNNYYFGEFDLTEHAQEIDTSQVGVHILSGEYDFSGTVELGRQAHEAIKGSSFTEMHGIGHFAMSEDPETFVRYLLPVLDQIHQSR